MRHFRTGGSRGRRSNGIRNIVNSYKKVLNVAPGSVAAGANDVLTIATGTDSATSGQTGPEDAVVPTGSIIKFITIWHGRQNLVNIAAFLHWSLQYIVAGQAVIASNVIGGSNQRNQVLRQGMVCVGQNQNVNVIVRFKVPAKFQRLREGMGWRFVSEVDVASTAATQCIYKFYR